MIKITRTHSTLTAKGHAENTTVCAMYTAVTVAFVKNIIERLKQNVAYTLQDGYFYIVTDDIDGEGLALLDAYWYTIRELQKSYPKSFDIRVSNQ